MTATRRVQTQVIKAEAPITIQFADGWYVYEDGQYHRIIAP